MSNPVDRDAVETAGQALMARELRALLGRVGHMRALPEVVDLMTNLADRG